MEKILGLINENNSITISELAKMIGLTTRAIEKQIDKLQKENKIERIGSRKSGHWRILPNPV
ncbi:MAG: winged helix-turn-helix transcriptional regulator [Bacteroidota bacterium]|nr:winged helix-turn-helix transcriptional regulator [Bacteroidota bacterium]